MIVEQQVPCGDGSLNLARGPEAGMPLLFLHGVGRCWQDFMTLIPALGWRWQIHGLDFRGHGNSQRTPDKYLVRDYVRDAVTVVREQIARPVVLYGHSLGALVAAATAAELPELVRGAVLEDPPFDTVGPGIRQTFFYDLFTAMRAVSGSLESVDQVAAKIAEFRITLPGKSEAERLGDLRDATALRFNAACLKRVDPRLWNPLIEGQWLDGFNHRAILRRIRCPVLLLQGGPAEGGMLSDTTAAEVESLVADCVRVRVAQVGHLIHEMQAATTVGLVSTFLESIAIGQIA